MTGTWLIGWGTSPTRARLAATVRFLMGNPRTRSDRPQTGALGELAAHQWLRRAGWRLLERNARTRYGELDIVARDRSTLVFVEVKARRGSSRQEALLALESIGPKKRLQIRRLARAWLAELGDTGYSEIRFDAIGVAVGSGGETAALEHLSAAF